MIITFSDLQIVKQIVNSNLNYTIFKTLEYVVTRARENKFIDND